MIEMILLGVGVLLGFAVVVLVIVDHNRWVKKKQNLIDYYQAENERNQKVLDEKRQDDYKR